MFRRRNYNISSLAVGHSEKIGMSRMTFVVECDFSILHLVANNLDKLVEVIEVENISENKSISRELALVKINHGFNDSKKDKITRMIDEAEAKILDQTSGYMIVEVTGNEEKINSFIVLLKAFDIEEVMRTGAVAMNIEEDIVENSENNLTN
jgi:acetolactate synthase-1/3 small subunit